MAEFLVLILLVKFTDSLSSLFLWRSLSTLKPRTVLKGAEKENSLIMTQTKKNPNLFSLNQVTLFSRH